MPHVRLAAYIDLRRETTFDDASESWIGLDSTAVRDGPPATGRSRKLVRTAGPQPRFVTAQRFQKLKQQMVDAARSNWNAGDRRRKCRSAVVLSAMNRHASPPVLDALLDEMTATG